MAEGPRTGRRNRCRAGELLPVLALAAGLAGLRLEAQPATNSFEAALRLFQISAFDLAEKELAACIANQPQSDRVPEARLFQAQCRFRLGDSEGALTLLRSGPGAAGALADQYAYWIAESLYQKGNLAEAAQAFSRMLADHPGSARRLDASVGEAYAFFRLGDLRRTFDLLRDPKGHFQQAAQSRAEDELAQRGYLLWAEVALALQDFPAAEEALARLTDLKLPAEFAWQREYGQARAQWARQQPEVALGTLTNLLAQMGGATNPPATKARADARSLQAAILEQQGQREAAIQAYEQNLGSVVPEARREEALQGIVRLALALGKLEEATARVEAYLQQGPGDTGVEPARMTLGELRLQQFYGTPETERGRVTNLLEQARQQFSLILTNSSSPLAPTACLNRGWAGWEEGRLAGATNLLAQATADFQRAAEGLPPSESQAIARFKLADGLFALGDHAAAASNYWRVVTNSAAVPVATNGLVDHALYQIVRASDALGDLPSANRSVELILRLYPDSFFGDRSVLFLGQAVSRAGRPAEAREVLEAFAKRFPGSELAAEAGLAVARTYQREADWARAGAEYDRWLARFTNHAARPKAEFERAWTAYRAGNETNALAGFMSLVAQFPNHPLAPWAQHWAADYHYRNEQFDRAEFDYQILFQNTNWPATELSQHARLMAGRAAFSRQDYHAARGYFTNLIADPAASTNLLPEAWFELGNTLMADKPAGTTNALANYLDALVAFTKIPQNFPESRFVPLAWGQAGNCDLQLGVADPKRFDDALEAYRNVLKSERADVATRSMAEVHIAVALEEKAKIAPAPERLGLVNEALARYLSVVTADLRPNETADPFWVKEAALGAARLAEEQQRWEVAASLYEKLKELSPPLRETWQARLERLSQLRQAAQPENK
jgi:tetratricopeptide (TPR) repeat protein